MRFLFNILFPCSLILASLLMSCDDQSQNDQLKRSINNLEVYVDSLERVHKSGELNYTQTEWQSIDSAYEARKSEAEMQMEGDKENKNANEKLNNIEARYRDLQSGYETHRQARIDEATRGLEAAARSLKLDGANASTEHITAQNYLQHYESFIETVDKYKRAFSSNDWNKLDAYRDRLKQRQDAINNKFTANDRIRIAELDTKYGALKIHKIGAKIEEGTTKNN